MTKLPQSLADISSLLSLMPICEKEIRRAQSKWPRRATDINAAFPLLAPSGPTRTEPLYRRHCRELLRRVQKDEALTMPTNAEVIGVLMNLSSRSPLKSHASHLYTRLFRKLFPKTAKQFDEDADAGERLHGREADDLEQDIRRKLLPLCEWRGTVFPSVERRRTVKKIKTTKTIKLQRHQVDLFDD